MKINDENLTRTYENKIYAVNIMVYSANFPVLITAKDTLDMINTIRRTDFSAIGDVPDPELDVTICEHFLTSDRPAMQRLFAFIVYSRYGNGIHYIISRSSGNPVLTRHVTPVTAIRTVMPLKIWHIQDETEFMKSHMPKRELERSMRQTEDIIRHSVLTDTYVRMGYEFNKKNELELDGYIRKGERAAFVFYDMSVSKIVNALEQIYTSQSAHIRLATTIDFFYISHKNQHIYKVACDTALQFIPLESILL